MSNYSILQCLTPVAAALAVFAAGAAQAQQGGAGGGPGTISGRVTDADGGPVAGQRVTARSTTYVAPGPAATATTGPDGRYTLRVDTGADARLFGPDAPPDTTFTVAAAPGDALYAVPPDRAVTLAGAPAAAGADFVVTPGPQITVRVRDALTGKGVPGVPVEYPSISGGDTPGDVVGTTDAQGVARFRSHRLDVTLQIRPRPSLTAAPGGSPYGMYKQYRLTPADSVVWDVSVYGPTGPVSGPWHGVLLGPDGRPVPGASVRRVGQQPSRPSITEQDVTDAGGGFTFPGTPLPAGDYRAGAEVDRLFADQGDAAAVLVPTPAEVAGGITLRLVRGLKASLTGRVTDPQGAPLAGVPVGTSGTFRGDVTAPAPPATYRGGPAPEVRGYTDSAGRFTLAGLYPDVGYSLWLGGGPSYDVDARTGGASFGAHYFAEAFYPPRGPKAPPVLLALEAGGRLDVGTVVVLRADATVAGRVVGPDGRPFLSVAVTLTGDHTQGNAAPDDGGAFHFEHVPDEPLTLSVYRTTGTRNSYSYRPGADSPDLVLRMPVTAGDRNVRVSVPSVAAPAIGAPPP